MKKRIKIQAKTSPNVILPIKTQSEMSSDSITENGADENEPNIANPRTVNLATVAIKRKDLFDNPKVFMAAIVIDPSETLTEITLRDTPQVTDIVFFWPKFSPPPFKFVSSLDISFCPNVTDVGIRWISSYFPSLKKLNAAGCRQVTETALRYLGSKHPKLSSVNFDMTSVRYIPATNIPVEKISTKHCPLLPDISTIPKELKIPHELPKEFTFSKVVIIKSEAMRNIFIGDEFAKIEKGSMIGAPSLVCCYKSGHLRLLECVEGPIVQLLLSNNCFVILPYLAAEEELSKEVSSVEGRFNLVAATIKNFKALAVPVWQKHDGLPRNVQHLSIQFNSAIQELTKGLDPSDDNENPTFPEVKQELHKLRFLLHEDLHHCSGLEDVLPWLKFKDNIPHPDFPKPTLLLFQALEKSKVLTQADRPFFNVDFLARNGSQNLEGELQPCWSSFVSLLAELGNIWIEPFSSNDGPIIGGKHIVAPIGNFVQFLHDLANLSTSTALAEDVMCLAPDTPLLAVDRIHHLINPTGQSLSNDDCIRFMRQLEYAGLAIFRRKYALATSSLKSSLPISLDHFVGKEAVSFTIEYPLLCDASVPFSKLVVMLAKVLPPTLLWRNGILLYEASFLGVLISFEDGSRTVKYQVLSGGIHNTQNLSNQKADMMIAAMQKSFSLIHSLCCLIVGPLASINVASLGRENELDVIEFEDIVHKIGPCPTDLFFGQLDTSIGRCTYCLLDGDVISNIRRYHLADSVMYMRMLQRGSVGENLVQLSLGDYVVSSSLNHVGLSGFVPVSVEFFQFDGLRHVDVFAELSPKERLRLIFDQNQLVDYFNTSDPTDTLDKSSDDGKKKQLISNGIRIDASCSEVGTFVTVTINGIVILERLFQKVITSSLTLLFSVDQPKLNAADDNDNDNTATAKDLTEFPLFVLSTNSGSSSRGLKKVKVGMRLEAVDLIYPHLIAVARIDQINSEGHWLIKFDNWGSRFDYWAEPTAPHLFPCGFMEYAHRATGVMDRLCQIRQKNMTRQLQRPKNTDYPQDPFPWLKYFQDLKSAAEHDIVAEPVPLEYFERTHLLGFDEDALADKYCQSGSGVVDDLSLGAFFVDAKQKFDEIFDSEQMSFRIPYYVPLPSLTWELCCWPSRDQLISETLTFPNFICGWPDFAHFVNESPLSLNLPAVADIPALHSALILETLIKQPHFIPENCDQLFEQLQLECHFRYPCMAKNDQSKSISVYIEHCLRQYLFPFILNHFVLLSSLYSAAGDEGEDPCVEAYLKKLHAPEHNGSRWSSVTVSSQQLTPKCYLLNMREAEDDFYVREEECPLLLCGQHACHYTTFSKAIDSGFKSWWTSLAPSVGHFHDKFIDVCALNETDIKELDRPLSTLHPFLSEFAGFVSDGLERSGLLSLSSLRELYLVNNEFISLPEAMAACGNTLVKLDLSRNLFTAIPSVVYKLHSLEYLRVDYVNLKVLDEDISQLNRLKMLSLRSNCLTSLPSGIKLLTALETLDLSGLPLLPISNSSLHVEEIAVYFENNRFPDEAMDILSDWLTEERVNSLDRSNIEHFNAYLFKKLPRLLVEKEDAFPLDLSCFINLKKLILCNQAIINVPDTIRFLQELSHLDFSGCISLKGISPKVANCPLERFVLNNTPELQTPPAEIRKRGLADTMNYFKRLEQGSVKCRRTKLMFVGLGGAGKTSLVQALRSSAKRVIPDVTDGIAITKWEVKAPDGGIVDFRMWDFAGQVVYYNTHQFFLSSRAVYLLLWNIRLGHEHAGLDFWLSSIASHAPNAPILIVGTHADEVAQERSFLPETAYRTRFESIGGFHYVSSHTGDGIADLKADIVRVALAQKHMGEAVPAAWLTFENMLLQPTIGDDDPDDEISVLMMTEVKRLAESSGIYNFNETDQALQFLSDLGTIQYFRTDFLRDRVIVNPQWIVDVMACIVSVKNMLIKEGRLLHEDIPKLWINYPKALHPWLLKLTEAFDLTFPLKKEPVSIVPCLLPENPFMENINWPSLEDNLNHHQTRVVFSFKYLPTGLFNRVQVRLCQFSDGATMWRKGSLLRKNQHVALLSQPDSTSIHVKVQGPCPENIAFLILEVVDTLIYESFQGVQPDYLFACPACVAARAPDPSMFERSRIRRAFELRIPFLQCWNYFHSVSTQELRQLFPAESSAEFETQFYRTVNEMSSIRQTLKIDILVIGNSADGNPADLENAVSSSEVGKDIEKQFPDLRVVTICDPDASHDSVSYDHLAVMMRMARIIVFCLSEQFMESDRCQSCLFTGRETLRKPVLMVFIREFDFLKHSALAFQMNDDIYAKAINRQRYSATDVAQKIQMRFNEAKLTLETAEVNKKKKLPDVFISYCWQNSADAVSRGTKAPPTAVGVADPRQIKKYLAEKDISCWIDIEQIGLGGLFRDIADGIRNAQVVVVCVSDEYIKSENCLREFHFSTTSCRRPVILCPVGTGVGWQTSEVNLIVYQSAATINFQVNLEDNYDALYKAVTACIKDANKDTNTSDNREKAAGTSEATLHPHLSKVGRRKTALNLNATSETAAAQKTLVLQEIIELGQRKMLRQLGSHAQSIHTRPYPRLVLLDVMLDDGASNPEPRQLTNIEEENDPESRKNVNSDEKVEDSLKANDENAKDAKEKADEEEDMEEKIGEIIEDNIQFGNAKENDMFSKFKWHVRFMCEHEGGWHASAVSIPVNQPAGQLFRQSCAYFGRMFTFLRHGGTSTINLLCPKEEEHVESFGEITSHIDKMVNPDEQVFDEHYVQFLQAVMQMDKQNSCGGLRRCLLAVGKELWLCEEHKGDVNHRSVGDSSIDGVNSSQEGAAAVVSENAFGGTTDPNVEGVERVRLGANIRPKLAQPSKSRACSLQ